MKTSLAWSDEWPEKDGKKIPVNDLAFKPDGAEIVVAVGDRVFVYDAEDGNLNHNLKGHKDTVYSVDYSKDGKRFASGGADKTVIIWTSKAEGILKYTHNESIQKVCYNPATQQLCSCTAIDFGLWSPDQKSVTKYKVLSKILSAAWSRDGQHLAIGMLSGQVSIRDKEGGEKATIEREAPAWCLQFCPARDSPYDLLAVGSWDGRLAFYQTSGVQQHKDRRLGFNPNGLSYFPDGEYIVLGGSDCAVTLCTKDGVKLGRVGRGKGWVWCVAARPGPRRDLVAVGDEGGQVQVFRVAFEPAHALYGERYAHREHMTDVIVQHLLTEQKVRIKCRDHVRRLALHRDRLAVQLPDRVHVYELTRRDDPYDMHYRVKEKVYRALECDQLAVAARHLLLCRGRALRLYSFEGALEREWVLRSPVRFLKVVGGQPGRENALVGLRDGGVLGVVLDNAFPRELAPAAAAAAPAAAAAEGEEGREVRCLDVDLRRGRLAVVDASSQLTVRELAAGRVLLREAGATAACFNAELPDALAYSDRAGRVHIKTLDGRDNPVQTLALEGHVVGFRGAKVFTLSGLRVLSTDVPQAPAMHRRLEARDFQGAYRLACLGVTEADWRQLAVAALRALRTGVARRAFVRLKDVGCLELVAQVEQRARQAGLALPADDDDGEDRPPPPPLDDPAYQQVAQYAAAELLARAGLFTEAAKTHARAGRLKDAIDLLVSLRQWEEAQVFAAGHPEIDARALVAQQGEWLIEVGDFARAAEMLVKAGKPLRAAKILGENRPAGWQEALSSIVQGVSNQEREVLEYAGAALSGVGADLAAKEVYLKLGDVSALMAIYVRRQDWEAAVALSEEHAGKFDRSVFLPYAEWLALNVRFDEALGAYRKAGRPDQSQKLMSQLTDNAVMEGRFKDAAYYYYLLGAECLRAAEVLGEAKGGELSEAARKKALAEYDNYNKLANLYFAYQHIYSFTTDPFTNLQPEMLFQVSRYVLNLMGAEDAPYGISRVNTLYTLAKQAKNLGAYKLARFAYDRLNLMRVPPAWRDQLDLDMLTVQAKPVRDTPEILPVCYRCGASNPLLAPAANAASASGHSGQDKGDSCTNCGHPFVRSFLSFEVLPLVEFRADPALSYEEALDLIRQPPGEGPRGGGKAALGAGGSWREQQRGGGDVLTMDNDDVDEDFGAEDDDEDLFNRCLNRTLEKQESASRYLPVTLDAKALAALKREEVHACPAPSPLARPTFFKNMLPEIPVAAAAPCNRFFHEEDFEFAYLKEGSCPFCRVKDVGYYGSV